MSEAGVKKTFTLAELSSLSGAKLHGNASHLISGVDELGSAESHDLSFLANPRYASALQTTQAGAICVDTNTPLIEGKNFIISSDPSKTFQTIAEILLCVCSFSGFEGIHPTAVIHPSAKVDANVQIGPYAVIDQGVEIGEGSKIGAFVFLGPKVKIGKDAVLYPHSAVRERCILGDRVILQPGAVIGSCGFGYITEKTGEHKKLAQLGIVIIEDDVEIGANTTIDRARFKTTRIKKGSKIDNLVQIAHNVEVGEHNIIAAQTGIAGSSKTEGHVLMGGQVGIVGHVKIGRASLIATRSGISKSLPGNEKYAGSPAIPLSEYNRSQVYLRNIEKHVKRIEELEKKLAALETALSQPQA